VRYPNKDKALRCLQASPWSWAIYRHQLSPSSLQRTPLAPTAGFICKIEIGRCQNLKKTIQYRHDILRIRQVLRQKAQLFCKKVETLKLGLATVTIRYKSVS